MIGGLMTENKAKNICQFCKKPVDLEKDDFVVGVSGNHKQFVHLTCIENNEKEEVKKEVIEQVENDYDLNPDSSDDKGNNVLFVSDNSVFVSKDEDDETDEDDDLDDYGDW